MRRRACDVLVIGSGPAGLAAAAQARRSGAGCVLVVERNPEPGGILPQCIHNGFGVRTLGADLSGPEYAARWAAEARAAGAEIALDTMVLAVEAGPAATVVSRRGVERIEAGAIVLAMGCRERPRGALAIPGSRPAGVYTAGTAQRLVNVEGYMPGHRFAILGSGDIGMIMARRLTLEGAEVVGMFEILPYISGLRRNLVQCVRDFDIPLHLCTTVTGVVGRDRVEAVITSGVDERWRPIPGAEQIWPCDALLLSVGLIPENELSRAAGVAIDPLTGGPVVDEGMATSVPGIFAAGNVVHVYDLVDDVTESALRAGRFAAEHAARGADGAGPSVRVAPGENVHHVVPQRVHPRRLAAEEVPLQFRVRAPVEHAVRVEVRVGGRTIVSHRERYVRPSEMVTVVLRPEHAARLAERESLEVCVIA